MTYPRKQDLQDHPHHCNRKQTTTRVRKRTYTDGCSVASSIWDREFQALCVARIADRHKHYNFCCFRALAYTTLGRLCVVFLYNICCFITVST